MLFPFLLVLEPTLFGMRFGLRTKFKELSLFVIRLSVRND